jgi:ketosteroid isomerase-like protein
VAEHPNAQLVRRLFEAFAARDAATVGQLIPDDAVWRFPGRVGGLAGEHRGRDAIIRFLTQALTLTNGTFSIELTDVTASDGYAVALFTGHGKRGDRQLNNPTCLKIRIRDGQLEEFDEFVWDLDQVEHFWS